jgi:hypothetical protein
MWINNLSMLYFTLFPLAFFFSNFLCEICIHTHTCSREDLTLR